MPGSMRTGLALVDAAIQIDNDATAIASITLTSSAMRGLAGIKQRSAASPGAANRRMETICGTPLPSQSAQSAGIKRFAGHADAERKGCQQQDGHEKIKRYAKLHNWWQAMRGSHRRNVYTVFD